MSAVRAKPAEPKPGDVLSGEAPAVHPDDFDVAEADVFDACMTWRHDFGLLPESDYERGVLVYDMRKVLHQFAERQRARFRRKRVLPPEPAKPATPDLDLAGRVGRCEAAIRRLCGAGGILVAGREEALKALEGGGSNG